MRLDFGDYIPNHKLQTWDNWLKNKLLHPRVYRYDRVDTRMPQFDLAPDEVENVMVVPREDGSDLVKVDGAQIHVG